MHKKDESLNGAVAVRPAEPPGADGQPAEGDGAAPRPFGLYHDAWGRLVLVDDRGRAHVGVEPVRGFPISAPGHGVSFCDAEGRELLWVEDVTTLPGPVLQVLEQDLARREFMPVLLRVVKVSAEAEPCEWEVETDRGATRFVLNRDDDVRRLSDNSALIVDSHGIRYLIPRLDSLDPFSRRVLERYL